MRSWHTKNIMNYIYPYILFLKNLSYLYEILKLGLFFYTSIKPNLFHSSLSPPQLYLHHLTIFLVLFLNFASFILILPSSFLNSLFQITFSFVFAHQLTKYLSQTFNFLYPIVTPVACNLRYRCDAFVKPDTWMKMHRAKNIVIYFLDR